MSSSKKLTSHRDGNPSADGSTEEGAAGGDGVKGPDNDVAEDAQHSLGFTLGLGRRSIPPQGVDGSACDRRNYPRDTYSFISNPKSKPISFVFGILVFSVQISLMFLLIFDETAIFNEVSSGSEHDDSEHKFLPANVEILVRTSQYLALVVYIVFSDGAMEDITLAIELIPSGAHWQMTLSCFLRFLQGTLGVVGTTLLIMITDRVRDAVLNILAMEFISQLDNMAFELMRNGRYSAQLQKEANKIADETLPDEYAKSYKNSSFCRIVVMFLAFVATLFTMGIYNYRQNNNKYVVDQFRVEFNDVGLKEHNGCYAIDANRKSLKQEDILYSRTDSTTSKVLFSFCGEKDGAGSWVLYEGSKDNVYACTSTPLARSSKSDSFNIEATFESNWFDVIGLPIDAAFFVAPCEVRNGICNPEYNNAQYGWDGGDCCADTCNKPECVSGTVKNAFDGTFSGGKKGFQNCQDPALEQATITITSIEGLWYEVAGTWFRRALPTMTFQCNNEFNHLEVTITKGMENQSETVFFEDWDECSLKVTEGDNIMAVNYSVEFKNIDCLHCRKELQDAVDTYLLHGPSKTRIYGEDIGSWDVSRISDFSDLFNSNRNPMAASFDSSLANWNTSRATDMSRMFQGASSFNSDLLLWNVGNVVNMAEMFAFTSDFNGDVSSWNVEKVTNMDSMFAVASSFNSNVSSWNVGKVANMYSMFFNASSFGSDVSLWNVGNVTNMHSMFEDASSFKSDVSSWNIEKVKDMSFMFWNASSFNIDVSLWQVNKVTAMSSMFFGASLFNQNLCSWGDKLSSSGVTFDGISGRTIFENSGCPCDGTPDLNLFPSTSFCACNCESTTMTVPILP